MFLGIRELPPPRRRGNKPLYAVPLGRFVDAYAEALVAIMRISSKRRRWLLEDLALLDRLVGEKLEADTQAIAAEVGAGSPSRSRRTLAPSD